MAMMVMMTMMAIVMMMAMMNQDDLKRVVLPDHMVFAIIDPHRLVLVQTRIV